MRVFKYLNLNIILHRIPTILNVLHIEHQTKIHNSFELSLQNMLCMLAIFKRLSSRATILKSKELNGKHVQKCHFFHTKVFDMSVSGANISKRDGIFSLNKIEFLNKKGCISRVNKAGG